jgi:murein DD-endopeptidase MepM/ murein hydrolase activator NlpD
MLVRKGNTWTFNRSVLISLSFTIIILGDFLASNAQDVLRAPWEGSATITQGNRGQTSHNVCGQRTLDPTNCLWENTFALDIGLNCGSPVLAASDGTVTYTDPDPDGLGGRELAITHQGLAAAAKPKPTVGVPR